MRVFSSCYTRLQHRRGWLLLMLLMLLLVSCWNLSRLQIEDSIATMLPDGKSSVARDFQLLQDAPFARKVVIHLRATSAAGTAQLSAATETLLQALPEPLFSNPISGPARINQQRLLTELREVLPLLLDADDLARLEQRLSDEGVAAVLVEHVAELVQLQGIFVKQRISQDPFSLYRPALQKLLALNPLPEVQLEGGQFVSHDGRSRLILADTPIAITDAVGGKELLEAFSHARRQLPPEISADLISGHAYTLANAEVIKADMGKLLLVSGGGLLLLFILMIGKLRAVPVLLLPLCSMAVALLVVSWRFDQVSGITIGFGAVLLGITIDFALHVYFALAGRPDGRAELLRLVARPVLFGGLTTLAAFTVLAFSDLPGQRQLGLFAGAGIVAAVLLALLVLPHFVPRTTGQKVARLNGQRPLMVRFPWLRRSVILIWAGVCGAALLSLPQLSLNGELRQLSYLPEQLQRAEDQLGEVWGDVRGRALIFVSGADLETALLRNEQVWQALQQQDLDADAVSLAPVLFADQTRQQRIEAWQHFWQQHQGATAEKLGRVGAGYGFSAQAFEPFFAQLDRTPLALDQQTLTDWGLGELVKTLLQEDEGGYRLMTLVPDRPESMSRLQAEGVLPEGTVLVSQSVFGRQLAQAIGADFYRFMGFAGVAVVVLLGLLFRRLKEVVLALLPAATGLVVMLGSMVWLGLELNLFNVIASLLIIGLGVDYGIFMVCHGQSKEDLASVRAVLVSGLSTLIGFGALTLAQHPALFSIGLTLLLGISAAMPTAVLVLPALRRRSRC